MEKRWRHPVVFVIAAAIGLPAAFVAFQTGITLYDDHRVRSVCAKLAPGTTLADARRIVAAGGMGYLFPEESAPGALGSYDETEKNWFFSIPKAAAMGDDRCAIYHDGRVIIKAEMVSL